MLKIMIFLKWKKKSYASNSKVVGKHYSYYAINFN